MKRFIYSSYTKFIAFMLCALSVAIASYIFTTSFLKEDGVYLFEESYEGSREAGNQLSKEFFSIGSRVEQTIDDNGIHLEKLSGMPSPDEWEYYIKVGNSVSTNTKNQTYADFENSKLAIGNKMTIENGEEYRQGFASPYTGYYYLDSPVGYEMAVRMGKKTIEESYAAWTQMKLEADQKVGGILALLIFASAVFVYLLCVTGKTREHGEEKVQMMLIDKMFVEITAALFLGIFIGGGAFVICGAYYLIVEEGIMLGHRLASIGVFAVVSLSLLCLLSLVRNLKNGTFIKRSMIVRIWKFAWRWFKRICLFIWNIFIKICRGIKNGLKTAKKTVLAVSAKNFDGKFVGILLAVYSVFAVILSTIAFASGSAVFVLLLMIFVAAAVWFVTKRLIGFNNLKNGIEKIKDGDLSHKIEDCPDGVIGAMAENINTIGDGLKKSLEHEVKAERMKSELITNVSHDLKTPLTSIINYADLLSKETLAPYEANDYVKIIKQKSERLKQLTNDLFDISKVQSGNEEFNIEEIDICLLVNQAMAELNESIKKSGLAFKVSASGKEVFVRADGRKLSRVFENLIVNCIKYAMANTRVYIAIKDMGDAVSVEIKNIAGYEMDFDEDEIAERFVRGDSSRSTEGSGLGLAIVKSYVEGCGGKVSVKKDGDLFKVILQFTK